MSNKQKHYRTSRALRAQEVFRVLEAWGLSAWSNLWNTVKYVARCIHSGKPIQDRTKGRWYLERDIQLETVRVLEEQAAANAGNEVGDQMLAMANHIRHKMRPTLVLSPMLTEAFAKACPKAEPEKLALIHQQVLAHDHMKWIKDIGAE